jgi:hypothetical protein
MLKKCWPWSRAIWAMLYGTYTWTYTSRWICDNAPWYTYSPQTLPPLPPDAPETAEPASFRDWPREATPSLAKMHERFNSKPKSFNKEWNDAMVLRRYFHYFLRIKQTVFAHQPNFSFLPWKTPPTFRTRSQTHFRHHRWVDWYLSWNIPVIEPRSSIIPAQFQTGTYS